MSNLHPNKPEGWTDRFTVRFASDDPKADADKLVEALERPVNARGEFYQQPWPWEWRIGYTEREVVLLIDAHSDNELRQRRVGLFQWREYLAPVTRAPEVERRLRERWPFDFVPTGEAPRLVPC